MLTRFSFPFSDYTVVSTLLLILIRSVHIIFVLWFTLSLRILIIIEFVVRTIITKFIIKIIICINLILTFTLVKLNLIVNFRVWRWTLTMAYLIKLWLFSFGRYTFVFLVIALFQIYVICHLLISLILVAFNIISVYLYIILHIIHWFWKIKPWNGYYWCILVEYLIRVTTRNKVSNTLVLIMSNWRIHFIFSLVNLFESWGKKWISVIMTGRFKLHKFSSYLRWFSNATRSNDIKSGGIIFKLTKNTMGTICIVFWALSCCTIPSWCKIKFFIWIKGRGVEWPRDTICHRRLQKKSFFARVTVQQSDMVSQTWAYRWYCPFLSRCHYTILSSITATTYSSCWLHLITSHSGLSSKHWGFRYVSIRLACWWSGGFESAHILLSIRCSWNHLRCIQAGITGSVFTELHIVLGRCNSRCLHSFIIV